MLFGPGCSAAKHHLECVAEPIKIAVYFGPRLYCSVPVWQFRLHNHLYLQCFFGPGCSVAQHNLECVAEHITKKIMFYLGPGFSVVHHK